MFLSRLESHPGIELLRVYCQGSGRGLRARVADLWHRRGWLGLPVLLIGGLGELVSHLRSPRSAIEIRTAVRRLEELIRVVPDVHDPRVLAEVEDLEPDLGLIYGGPILRPELFELPRLGTLGIHHGRMPEYRGKKTTFWEVYNGEEIAGVTIQRVNAGIDTGDIVRSGSVRIGRKGYGRVWRQVQRMGVGLYLDAIIEVGEATVEPQARPTEKGRLYRDPTTRDLARLWLKQLTRRLAGR